MFFFIVILFGIYINEMILYLIGLMLFENKYLSQNDLKPIFLFAFTCLFFFCEEHTFFFIWLRK